MRIVSIADVILYYRAGNRKGIGFMSLAPDNSELLARARGDLRMGLPTVLNDGLDSALIASAETLDAERLADLRKLNSASVLAITARRAETLKARPYDGDLARILIPAESDINWIRSVADPATDMDFPMKGPFASERNGGAELHRVGINIAKSARLLPAVLVIPIREGAAFAERHGLTALNAGQTANSLDSATDMRAVANSRLPLEVSEAGRVHVFRPVDGGEEHYAVEIGQPAREKPLLARLHSACFTGDLIGSLKCDCGHQLRRALSLIGGEGAGVLLYLNQEGRGIGLANKMRAYSLQNQGFDTVEANHRLGFEDDERDFRIGAVILKQMGFSSVRLITNNPAKISMMERNGISVTARVPIIVGQSIHNRDYMAVKARKSGHLL